MKAHLASLAAIALTACTASAQIALPGNPYQPYPVRVAPDMCGGYCYMTDGYAWYPSYCVVPQYSPVTGIVPYVQPPMPPGGPGSAQQQPFNTALPYNPWTRSPRDFFMWSEAQKQLHTREARPPFGP